MIATGRLPRAAAAAVPMAERDEKRAATAPPGSDRSRLLALLLAAGLLVAVLVVVLLGRGGEEDGEEEEAAALRCEPAPDEGAELPCPTELVTEPAEVRVRTDLGGFTISLDPEASPATTSSFRYLVEEGFYDGLGFHRVAPGFVIQGGDPNGDGSGGPGYFVDEDVPEDVVYDRGTVAMAKTAADPPGRSGSQFFVVSGPDAGLPPEYAYLGRVEDGIGTVEEIDALGRGDGPPRRPVTIRSMVLEEAS
jgi:peptidyl-prolyl cis-trans isomerase B (cyclophilin B)